MLEKLTLCEVLNRSAEKYPDRIALSSIDGNGITYREFKSKVNSVSNFLAFNSTIFLEIKVGKKFELDIIYLFKILMAQL